MINPARKKKKLKNRKNRRNKKNHRNNQVLKNKLNKKKLISLLQNQINHQKKISRQSREEPDKNGNINDSTAINISINIFFYHF